MVLKLQACKLLFPSLDLRIFFLKQDGLLLQLLGPLQQQSLAEILLAKRFLHFSLQIDVLLGLEELFGHFLFQLRQLAVEFLNDQVLFVN